MNGCKLIDSASYHKDLSIHTVLGIKDEQRYLNASFKGYVMLISRARFKESKAEPMLFATLKNDNFYLLNQNQSAHPDSKIKSILHWIKGISFRMSSK